MARPYSLDLRKRVVCAVKREQSCRAGCCRLWCEHGQRCEVIAARALPHSNPLRSPRSLSLVRRNSSSRAFSSLISKT